MINYTSQLSLLRIETASQFWNHFAGCFVNSEVRTINSNSAKMQTYVERNQKIYPKKHRI